MTSHKLGLLPPTARPRVHLSSFLTREEPRAVSVDYLDRVTDWCSRKGTNDWTERLPCLFALR